MKCTCFNATILIWSAQNDELFTTPADVGSEEIELISYAGSGLQTNLSVWWICWRPDEMLERMQANHEEMNHSFLTSSYYFAYYTMWWNSIWWIWSHILHSEAYAFVNYTNSSAGWNSQSNWVGPWQWMHQPHDWWQEAINEHSTGPFSPEAYHLRW